jgi:hypothetical protein
MEKHRSGSCKSKFIKFGGITKHRIPIKVRAQEMHMPILTNPHSFRSCRSKFVKFVRVAQDGTLTRASKEQEQHLELAKGRILTRAKEAQLILPQNRKENILKKVKGRELSLQSLIETHSCISCNNKLGINDRH